MASCWRSRLRCQVYGLRGVSWWLCVCVIWLDMTTPPWCREKVMVYYIILRINQCWILVTVKKVDWFNLLTNYYNNINFHNNWNNRFQLIILYIKTKVTVNNVSRYLILPSTYKYICINVTVFSWRRINVILVILFVSNDSVLSKYAFTFYINHI